MTLKEFKQTYGITLIPKVSKTKKYVNTEIPVKFIRFSPEVDGRTSLTLSKTAATNVDEKKILLKDLVVSPATPTHGRGLVMPDSSPAWEVSMEGLD